MGAVRAPDPPPDPLQPLRRALLCASALVPLLGLLVELAHHTGGGTDSPLVPLLSMSEEGNVPTWYSSALLLGCGAGLLAIAAVVRRAGGAFARRWELLGLLFLFLSLDEAAQLHERLNGLLHLRGALYFGWILPVGAALVPLGLAYLRFLRHLPPPIRWRFVLSGALYVGGALGMEVPLGVYAERHGADTLGYALLDLVEETMEVWGATLFLLALARHLMALTRPAAGGEG